MLALTVPIGALALPAAATAATTPGYPSAGTLPSGAATALSADGSTYVTGDPVTNTLRVYRRPATGWGTTSAQPAVVTTAASATAELGTDLAISDDGSRIVATAPSQPIWGSANTGSTFVFERPATGWASGTMAAQELTYAYAPIAISGDGSTIATTWCCGFVDIHIRGDEDFEEITTARGVPGGGLRLNGNGSRLLGYERARSGPGQVAYFTPDRGYWWDGTTISSYSFTGPGGTRPQGWPSDVAMSPRGGTLVVGVAAGDDSSLLVYDIYGGSCCDVTPRATLRSGEPIGTAADRVAISQDGSTIASRRAGGGVDLFRRSADAWASTNVATATIDEPASSGVGHLLLSGDGESILAGSDTLLTAFGRDRAGPVTSAGIGSAQPEGRDGWHVRPVTVTVSAADEPNGSGLAETRCALDPGSRPQRFDDLPSTPCPYLDAGGRAVTATGDHAVYAASRDSFGNDGDVAEVRFKLDTVAPVLQVPGSITVDAPTPGGTAVDYRYRAIDDFAGEVPAACGPGPSAYFPVGLTTVNCSALDPAGNVGTAAFQVTVRGEPLPLPDPSRGAPQGDRPPSTGTPDEVPAPRGGRPSIAPPRLSALVLRGRTLAVHVSSAATVRAELARCARRRQGRRQVTSCRTAAVASAKARAAGTVKLRLPRRLQSGRYRLTVRAGGPGGRSVALVRTVRLP